MKKILPLICMLACCYKLDAQSMTVVNHTTCGASSRYQITLWAYSSEISGLYPLYCGGVGCSNIKAYSFYSYPGTTMGWCDPRDFEDGYCSSSAVLPGYSDIECLGITSGSIKGTGCGPNSWTCSPLGWVWTYADIDLGCMGTNTGCLAGVLRPASCGGNNPLYGSGAAGCTGATFNYATWTDVGGNITIHIFD